jgi:signal recognition particle subunit SRP54
MLEVLTGKLQSVFTKLGSHGTITEKHLDEALREVRIALLEADVNFKVVREFIASVRERALGAEVLKSLTGPQQVIAIVHEELMGILGGSQSALSLASQPPTVIMLVGLKGSGKTTTAAKLALHLRKGGARPLLVAADPHRVAAGEQLQALGRQLNIAVSGRDGAGSPGEVCARALKEAHDMAATVLIVDTAGYIQVGDEMLSELTELRRQLSPSEVLLVVDAMTGQEAVNVAQELHDALEITGFVITKMDGDARGGAALSIRAVTGLPVKFIGAGEKTDALEPFYPDRFASRILGMGDVVSLAEKAREAISEDEAKAIQRKIKTRTLDLEDFLEQFQRVKGMGPLGQILEMLPGMAAAKDKVSLDDFDETFGKKMEAIIYSMTPFERHKPEVIDGSRRRRIARGSGTTPQDVNQLLKQWREAKKLMQAMSSGRGAGLLGRLPGRGVGLR